MTIEGSACSVKKRTTPAHLKIARMNLKAFTPHVFRLQVILLAFLSPFLLFFTSLLKQNAKWTCTYRMLLSLLG